MAVFCCPRIDIQSEDFIKRVFISIDFGYRSLDILKYGR
jgi:hypothetical protein